MAFTELQVYNLLTVLSDETIRMSYSTMERMVIDAVKGAPTTAPSRTAHFRSRDRAQTPGPMDESGSSLSESESEVPIEVETEGFRD